MPSIHGSLDATVRAVLTKVGIAFLALITQPAGYATTLEDLIKSGAIPPLPKRTLAKILIEHTEENDRITSVFFSERAPNTRSAIHAHDHGGVTCLIEGEMTLYVEGRDPITRRAGECYYMPSGVRMTGVNTGKETAKFIDFFNYKSNESFLRVTEGNGCGSKEIDLSQFCDNNPYIMNDLGPDRVPHIKSHSHD